MKVECLERLVCDNDWIEPSFLFYIFLKSNTDKAHFEINQLRFHHVILWDTALILLVIGHACELS